DTLVPVPLEYIDAVTNWNDADKAVFKNDLVQPEKVRCIRLIPNQSIALPVFCTPGRCVQKDQTGRGFTHGNTGYGIRQACGFSPFSPNHNRAHAIRAPDI